MSFLATEETKECEYVHHLVENLNEDEVEWTNEAQEHEPEEDHEVALATYLGRLIHTIVEKHVDNGGVSYEKARADGYENDQDSYFKGVFVLVLRLHAFPVNLVQQNDVREEVETFHDRGLHLLDDREHVSKAPFLHFLV